MKAEISGARPYGVCYQEFKNFIPKDIRQHVGIYILHRLSISPQEEMKFKTYRTDKVHGNCFIYNLFGPNTNNHQNHFKAIFY